MKSKIVFSFIFLLILASSCHKDKEVIQFTLYIEHIGSINICKDFRVTIDNQEKLLNQLCSTGVQQNFTTVTFLISSGKHTLKAEVLQDSKTFEQVIDFNNSNKFGYLTYNNNSLEFTLTNPGGPID